MKCTIWVDLHSRCSVEPVSESNCLLNKRFDITFYCSMGKNLGMITLLNWLLHVPVVLQMEPPLKTHNWPFSAHEQLQLYIGYLCWLWLAAAAGTLSVSSEWAGPGGQWKTSPTPRIQERIMNIYCVSSNNIQGHLFKKVATPENWFITNMEMDCHQGWIRKNIYLEKF